MSWLTSGHLRSILNYNPQTGVFIWINPPRQHPRMKGKAAGCLSTGYVMIKIGGRGFKAHRLAWLYVHGEWPAGRIDHKDGNPFNNAIANLRVATQAQNCANAARWNGKELPKGVRRLGSKFQARISHSKKLIHLGSYETPGAAADAYRVAAINLYGEFARPA